MGDMRRILLLACFFVVIINAQNNSAGQNNTLPVGYSSWSVEKKVDWLMEHMTLAEKINQLNYDSLNAGLAIVPDRFHLPRFKALDGPRGIHDTSVEVCYPTPKHFACNSFETGRFRVNVNIDERVLREIYLSAFRMCIEEGKAKSIMSAYKSGQRYN